jgi:hypothetical protein
MTTSLQDILDGVGLHATTPTGTSYRQQTSAINCLSYSTQLTLHGCPRRFLLDKLTAEAHSEQTSNVDFLFGHAVGAGVQNFLATQDADKAIFEAFISWKGDLFIEGSQRKRKSFWYAMTAIQQFASLNILDGWKLAVMGNGQPAIEVAFSLNLENGYRYLGHIDVILEKDGEFKILELKTTSATAVDEATYKNSAQAVGYSLVLDALKGKPNYTVMYLVYKTSAQEFEILEFFKTRIQRASWLLQLQIDCNILDTFRQIDFYPMHGESCHNFFRQCEYFGMCDMKSYVDGKKAAMWESAPDSPVEGITYYFNLAEIETSAIS